MIWNPCHITSFMAPAKWIAWLHEHPFWRAPIDCGHAAVSAWRATVAHLPSAAAMATAGSLAVGTAGIGAGAGLALLPPAPWGQEIRAAPSAAAPAAYSAVGAASVAAGIAELAWSIAWSGPHSAPWRRITVPKSQYTALPEPGMLIPFIGGVLLTIAIRRGQPQ